MATATGRRFSTARGGVAKALPTFSRPGFLKAISGHLNKGKRVDADTVLACYSPQEKARWGAIEKSAMSESSGILGGYLVPQEFSYELFRSIAENTFIEPRACVVPMTSAETLCPRMNVETDQGPGISPFFGGINFSWNGTEGSTVADASSTNPFKQVSLKAWDLIGELELSNQFMTDLTEEGEARLLDLIARAAAWYKEYAFFYGTGTANLQPLGILNADATKFVTRAGSNAIAIADIAKMTGTLIPYSWNHSIWACSPSALEQVVKITGFIPNMDPLSTEMGCAGSLMTRPLFVTEKLPKLGTPGDILLFDPSLYVIGNRQDVYITSSAAPSFRTNMTWLKVWIRCDGKPLTSGTITLADSDTVASAFVGLAA